MPDGGFVAISFRPDGMADDCERAALVVTTKPAPQGCAGTVIDLERLRRQGAMALRRVQGGFAVEAVKPRGVDRPWAPAAEGDAEAGPAVLPARPATPPRAVDATPAEADLQTED